MADLLRCHVCCHGRLLCRLCARHLAEIARCGDRAVVSDRVTNRYAIATLSAREPAGNSWQNLQLAYLCRTLCCLELLHVVWRQLRPVQCDGHLVDFIGERGRDLIVAVIKPNFPTDASDSRNAPENCGLLRPLSICGAKNHCPFRGHLALTGSTLMCWRRCSRNAVRTVGRRKSRLDHDFRSAHFSQSFHHLGTCGA